MISIADRQRSFRPDLRRLRGVLAAVLERGEAAAGRARPSGDLSVAIVDDREIARVHGEHLDDPTPTDVISFAFHEDGSSGPGPFGEIVVSAETALRQARARGIEPQEELERYAIHGLLHILGHDDRTPAGRRRMRAIERRFLALSGRPAAPGRPSARGAGAAPVSRGGARSSPRRGARRRRRTPPPGPA